MCGSFISVCKMVTLRQIYSLTLTPTCLVVVLDRIFVTGFERKCPSWYTAIEIVHSSHFTMAACYIVLWKNALTHIWPKIPILSSQHAYWQEKESLNIGGHAQDLRLDNLDSFSNEYGWVLNAGAQE